MCCIAYVETESCEFRINFNACLATVRGTHICSRKFYSSSAPHTVQLTLMECTFENMPYCATPIQKFLIDARSTHWRANHPPLATETEGTAFEFCWKNEALRNPSTGLATEQC